LAIQEDTKADQISASIQIVKRRFRSGGKQESEIECLDLKWTTYAYPSSIIIVKLKFRPPHPAISPRGAASLIRRTTVCAAKTIPAGLTGKWRNGWLIAILEFIKTKLGQVGSKPVNELPSG